ncbi:MAG: hypothetical protein ACRD2I_20465 [Vicinamibacterales bacterium]
MISGASVRTLPMISVADLIVAHLRRAGVGFIFGVPGGGQQPRSHRRGLPRRIIVRADRH